MLFFKQNKWETLTDVVSSVTGNAAELGAVAVLGFVIFYFFAIFAFWFEDDMYYDGNMEGGERTCSNLL